MTPTAPRRRSDFKVAIICALPVEADKVQLLLDKCWDDEGRHYGIATGDHNTYTTGVLGGHNVVLAHMPAMGESSAASVAANLRFSYTRIQLVLLVGICGVVPINPETNAEILLGDIIVSTAVVQYDFGRQYHGGFKRKQEIENSLAGATPRIQAFLNKSQTHLSRRRLCTALEQVIQSESFRTAVQSTPYPGAVQDRLYEASYPHQHRSQETCEKCHGGFEACPRSCEELGCRDDKLVQRPRLLQNRNLPSFHFGRFGSANTVMKSGLHRDSLATADNLIAFEMEGAGVRNQFPTIVIKAACDYADSHKNKRWQGYSATTAAAFAKVLLQEWPSDQEPDEEGVSEPVWHMPHERIPGFIGRSNEISRLKQSIMDKDTLRVAILGLGGVGKSRLVLELAYQFRYENPQWSVFWVQAADQATFEKDLSEIGKKLGIAGINNEQADVKNLVMQELSLAYEDKWLMILDNADDEALWTKSSESSLVDYLPRTANGTIVVTSRTRIVATCLAGKGVVELSEMPPNEAIEMLTRGLWISNGATFQTAASDVQALVDKLAYLPLAIIQATSFMNQNQVSISAYLDLLDDQDGNNVIELLSKDFEEPSGYQRSLQPVATTWLITFQRIRDRHPLAAEYLTCMACLCEKNIPLSLLPKYSNLDAVVAIGVLIGYSFVRKQSEHNDATSGEPLYDMHRLVHLCMRSWLEAEGQLAMRMRESCERIEMLFPRTDFQYKDQWRLLSAHVQRLCADSNVEYFPARYSLLRKASWFMVIVDGSYQEATKVATTVVHWLEKTLGPLHRDTLVARAVLGDTMFRQGRYQEAEHSVQMAVDGQSKVLGEDHLDTLYSMSNLSLLYCRNSRHKEAMQLAKHIFETRKRICGIEHPTTLTSMDNLAVIYSQTNQLSQAEELARRALEMWKRTVGIEDPSTLFSMQNLASIWMELGRRDEAIALLRQCVEIQKTSLHPEHAETLSNSNLLAKWIAAGNVEKQEPSGRPGRPTSVQDQSIHLPISMGVTYLASMPRRRDRLMAIFKGK